MKILGYRLILLRVTHNVFSREKKKKNYLVNQERPSQNERTEVWYHLHIWKA